MVVDQHFSQNMQNFSAKASFSVRYARRHTSKLLYKFIAVNAATFIRIKKLKNSPCLRCSQPWSNFAHEVQKLIDLDAMAAVDINQSEKIGEVDVVGFDDLFYFKQYLPGFVLCTLKIEFFHDIEDLLELNFTRFVPVKAPKKIIDLKRVDIVVDLFDEVPEGLSVKLALASLRLELSKHSFKVDSFFNYLVEKYSHHFGKMLTILFILLLLTERPF